MPIFFDGVYNITAYYRYYRGHRAMCSKETANEIAVLSGDFLYATMLSAVWLSAYLFIHLCPLGYSAFIASINQSYLSLQRVLLSDHNHVGDHCFHSFVICTANSSNNLIFPPRNTKSLAKAGKAMLLSIGNLS